MASEPRKRRKVKRVADALLSSQPELIAAYGRARCVICTRIAVEIGRQQGLRTEPLAVAVDLTNDHSQMRLGFEPPEEVPPGNWNGHLVCVLENSLLVDLTLDTATRPELELRLRPTAVNVPSGFAGGGTVETTVGGTHVRYEAHPEEKGFLALEDWSDKLERERTLGLVRKRLSR